MTHRLDVARGRNLFARWCALAEQRLEHLTELFESGRWRRYHSELAFLENIQEAKAAVEIWRDLSTREAQRDNSAFNISWLGHAATSLPRSRDLPDPAHRPAAPPSEVTIAPQIVHLVSDDAPSAPDVDAAGLYPPAPDSAPELTLDLAVMQARYPLLRNAL
jgi:uncharacterized repeat protein (TIGR03809 family)